MFYDNELKYSQNLIKLDAVYAQCRRSNTPEDNQRSEKSAFILSMLKINVAHRFLPRSE